jgi:hypothetical protein
VVEVPMVVWLSRRFGAPIPRVVLVSLGANLLTHGALWTTFGWIPGPYVPKLLVAETGVWLVEAGIYSAYGLFSWPEAIGISLAANALTTAIGLWRMALAGDG